MWTCRRLQCGADPRAGSLLYGCGVEDTPRWVSASGLNGTERGTLSLCVIVTRRYYLGGRGPGIHIGSTKKKKPEEKKRKKTLKSATRWPTVGLLGIKCIWYGTSGVEAMLGISGGSIVSRINIYAW